MHRLVFWLTYPLLWFISILPFRVFYLVSDMVFVLVYHIFGYRRKTVKENLDLVFPEKSTEEKKSIQKKFYRHMCDIFLEMIKTISISDEELKKRFVFTNPEEFERLKKLNKSIVAMCGHYASYEWMIALQLHGIDYKAFGIYKKVKNPYFDKMARDIRGKFNGELIPTVEATSKITALEESGQRGVYAMIADQSPKRFKKTHWIDFMGIKAPVFIGSEVLARKLDMAVVYLNVEKVKRGHYAATLINISDNPRQEPEFAITKEYIKLLERQIHNDPQYYLWTHKRWKHRNRPITNDSIVID